MKRVFPRAVLVIVAMVGGALALVALVSMARGLGIYGIRPEDALPKEQTILLVHRPSDALIERLPVLAGVPTDGAEAIALLQTKDDDRGTVSFRRDGAERRIGRYGFVVSDPLLLPLIAQGDHVLGKDEAYRALRAQIPAETPWAFLRRADDANAPWTDRILAAAILGDAESVAFTAGEYERGFRTPERSRPDRQAPSDVAVLTGAFLTVTFADATTAWDDIRNALPEDDMTILEGLLGTFLRRFGAHVGLRSDVLPLLAEPGSLQLSASGSVVDMLAEGSLKDTDRLNDIRGRLHASFEATLPSSRITRRTLDKRFSSLDIREDQSLIERDASSYKGWSIRSSRAAGSSVGLMTAVRGKRFLIATRDDMLVAAIDARNALALPERNERSALTAGGSLRLEALGAALRSALPNANMTERRFGTGTLLFASYWQNNVRSVVLRTSQKFPEPLDSLP